MVYTLLCSSAVRIYVSHAYRNIDMTSDRISLILDRRVMFLSFHISFSLVIAAVVWAIFEMISGLDLSSVITEPRYLNLDTVGHTLTLIKREAVPYCTLIFFISDKYKLGQTRSNVSPLFARGSTCTAYRCSRTKTLASSGATWGLPL